MPTKKKKLICLPTCSEQEKNVFFFSINYLVKNVDSGDENEV